MSRMKGLLYLIILMSSGILYRAAYQHFRDLPIPNLPLDQWWGDGKKPNNWTNYLLNTSSIINNRISYPREVIDDLKKQLNYNFNFIEPLEGVGFEYGFNTNYLTKLINYWRDNYLPRWLGREIFLWQFNHFTTHIQGLRLHFLHLMVYEDQTIGKHHYPILLLHGWPGSIRKFYPIIRKLYDPPSKSNQKYIFNVVVPSLPGFAWSQGTSRKGLGPAQIAVIIRNLMLRLGYQKFFIQGENWGSTIGSHIATLFPDNVIGYHSNHCAVFTSKSVIKALVASFFPNYFVPTEFKDFFFPLTKKLSILAEKSGYLHLQATKPDTISTVLQNNPIGLAVYILENFSTWSKFTNRQFVSNLERTPKLMDALLDNIMIYYLTDSISTSQRIYYEHYYNEEKFLKLDRVPTLVPTGCARFQNELIHYLDFQLIDKYQNLIHSTYYREDGHFATYDSPQLLYEDFLQFVQKVEKLFNTTQYSKKF